MHARDLKIYINIKVHLACANGKEFEIKCIPSRPFVVFSGDKIRSESIKLPTQLQLQLHLLNRCHV